MNQTYIEDEKNELLISFLLLFSVASMWGCMCFYFINNKNKNKVNVKESI